VRLTGADDVAAFGNGSDNRLIGNKGANSLQGFDGDDMLSGGRGWDQLNGGVGKDTLIGGAASDLLHGGAGNDTLIGGGGFDGFVFDTAPNSGFNRDTVEDFDPVEDQIFLDDAVFSKLGAGGVTASSFLIGPAAADADDRIVYDQATGALFYDRDGDGGAAAVQFAMLDPGLALTSLEFTVY
jgi:Ca2+-binding RTX toxin-like protein